MKKRQSVFKPRMIIQFKIQKITCIIRYLIAFILCYSLMIQAAMAIQTPVFHSKISTIPLKIQKIMQLYTWHSGCPVPLNDLAYVQLSYWGYDNKPHQGILIVNKHLALQVEQIFHDLYLIKFPIAKMQPLDAYKGDDEKSMADNNTSAFNCRAITGYTNVFSPHSYGSALDINPLINPYIHDGVVLPTKGSQFLSRNPNIKGIIVKGNAAYTIFIKYGWQWGGEWTHLKDYQHFEKDE